MNSEAAKDLNISSATLKGVEIEFYMELDDYILNAQLDYLDTQDDKDGNFLDGRARASATIELGKQIENLYIGVDAFA